MFRSIKTETVMVLLLAALVPMGVAAHLASSRLADLRRRDLRHSKVRRYT